LDPVQIFTRVSKGCFLGVAIEWQLGDEDVWLGELEYQLKKVITFDPTVGSHSNFYRGFRRLLSWGSYGMETR
jgi:hypothetical protein